MAANGISTLADKAARKAAKIALAQAKRQDPTSGGYRELNVYAGTVSPESGRPWATSTTTPLTSYIVDENSNSLVDENGNNIIY